MSKLEKIQKYVEKGKVDKLIAITHEKDKEVRIAAIEKTVSERRNDTSGYWMRMGYLLIEAAKKYGVHGTGITLSKEQYKEFQRRIGDHCLLSF